MRKISWVLSDGTPAPGLEKMVDAAVVLSNIQRVLSGQRATVRDVHFWDPNFFKPGNFTTMWPLILGTFLGGSM